MVFYDHFACNYQQSFFSIICIAFFLAVESSRSRKKSSVESFNFETSTSNFSWLPVTGSTKGPVRKNTQNNGKLCSEKGWIFHLRLLFPNKAPFKSTLLLAQRSYNARMHHRFWEGSMMAIALVVPRGSTALP